MSLEHIILGALEKPQSGYGLKRWFDEVFSFFWNADQSQIYRTIARLADRGLVTGKAAASAIGPDKRVYRTTSLGKAELRRWLEDGPTAPAQRTAIYAQLIFLSHLPDAEAARFLATMKSQTDETVAALERVDQADLRPPAPARTAQEARVAFFNRASLALGLERARATQRFVNDLVESHAQAFSTGENLGNAA